MSMRKVDHRVNGKKPAMLEALKQTYGIVTPACDIVGIHRKTHYDWLEKDPEYKAAVEDIQEVKVDFIETALTKRINEGDTSAIIFAAKCLGKKRGYRERTELDVNLGFDPTKPLEVKFGE